MYPVPVHKHSWCMSDFLLCPDAYLHSSASKIHIEVHITCTRTCRCDSFTTSGCTSAVQPPFRLSAVHEAVHDFYTVNT